MKSLFMLLMHEQAFLMNEFIGVNMGQSMAMHFYMDIAVSVAVVFRSLNIK